MALVPFPSSSPANDPNADIELTDADDDLEGGKMSFLEHLDELRKRLIVCCWAIGAGCLVSFAFVGRIQAFIMEPLTAMMGGVKLLATAPAEPFMLMIKIGALAGLLLALPVIIFQFWLFIAPGLYATEKRFAIPFVVLGTGFFLMGAAFSHYVAFPYTWSFFLDFGTDYLEIRPAIGLVFSLWVKMLLGLGVVFQMPTVVFFLARMGIVNARFLIKHIKYATLVIFVLGAILSPGGDIPSQLVMAGPMMILYGISIAIAWLFAKKPDVGE